MAIKKDKEGVDTLYKDGTLVALIKRDLESKKHLIYLVKEASSDDIANLFAEDGFEIKSHTINQDE